MKRVLFILLFCLNAHAAYNFDVVVSNENYQIYRSGELGSKGLAYLRNHLESENLPFPKTIVYLNRNGFSFVKEERNLQKTYGYTFYHHYLDGHRPNFNDFYTVLDIILDKNNQPVLFHCYGGRHRTGMVGLAIRYLQDGNWVNGIHKRMFVMPRMRYYSLNPAQYEYAKHNKILFRLTNLRYIEEMSKSERFKELKQLYSAELNGVNDEI